MRRAEVIRETSETRISVSIVLDSSDKGLVDTPIGFFNHMLEAFARHGGFCLNIKAEGDLHVDQHHLLEDCGLVLGEAFDKALGNRAGIYRAGHSMMPMDDALAVAVIDLGGRPWLNFSADFKRRFCGDMDSDLLRDFFQAFSVASRSNLVIKLDDGVNDHHKIESIFKAFGRAMRAAFTVDPLNSTMITSTKGVL